MSNSDQQIAFKIHGLDCVEEVRLLKRELVPLLGGEDRLQFDLLRAKLSVDLGSSPVKESDVVNAIERTGLRHEHWTENPSISTSASWWTSNARLSLTALSGGFGFLGLLLQLSIASDSSQTFLDIAAPAAACYLISISSGLFSVFPKAWRSLTSLRPDMNLLMVVAVTGAVLIGEWLEGAMVSFLFSLSLLLESWSVGKARSAITSLMDLTPPQARLANPSGEQTMCSPEEIEVGSTIIVRPGERIGLDGNVLTGQSEVDQSPITGESVPAAKQPGDPVFAGTINGSGLLEIQTTRPADQTTLANIIRTVVDAGTNRAEAERWVEKFATIYTPTVMLLALLVMLVPAVAAGAQWSDWIYRSLVLLVIACPCALVISTPVSVVAAIASAARNGILIKGGVFVELPATLKAIALDKTGTLTSGKLSVAKIVAVDANNEDEVLKLAGALELNSNHPLAKAIIGEASRREITLAPATNFTSVGGKGVQGMIDGDTYWLGSQRYLHESIPISESLKKDLQLLREDGNSIVVVGNEKHIAGYIALADTIRPESRKAVEQLHQADIGHVVMLTGDNSATANAIGHQAGVDEVSAELLPEDKVKAIEDLVAKYQHVAMIGDGINDAPALARATVGIAMGAMGSDVAIQTADIALMSDDLSKNSVVDTPRPTNTPHHSAKRLLCTRCESSFCRTDFRWLQLLVGCDRRRYRSVLGRDCERPAVAEDQSPRLTRGSATAFE